jgi:peroxin-16
MLEIIRYTQLVLEMALKRTTGNKGRWRGIVIIELIRYLVLFVQVRPVGTDP